MFKRPLYKIKDRTKFQSKKITYESSNQKFEIINVSTFSYCPIFGIKYKIIQIFQY